MQGSLRVAIFEWGEVMPKSSGRAFHAGVSVLALLLAAASGTAIWYQYDPGAVARLLAPLLPGFGPKTSGGAAQPTPAPSGTTTAGNTTAPGQTAPAGANSVTQAQPGTNGRTQATDLSQVRVRAFDKGVSATELATVKRLLNQGGIVDEVTSQLQLHLKSPVNILLASSKPAYTKALAQAGMSVSDARELSQDTGGFTQDSLILIPMYQNTSTPDLGNTLGHELVHVVLNQDVGQVPSWMNEGLAVYTGMAVERRMESSVAYNGYARQLAETVVQAATDGKWVPLANSESALLGGSAPYDLELQDWLAVAELFQTRGQSRLPRYFQRLRSGVSADAAFQNAFGLTRQALDARLRGLAQQAARMPNPGLDLTLSVPNGFTGYIRILPRNSQVWQSFRATPGDMRLTITPDGRVTGVPGAVTQTRDSAPADPETLYINLSPTHSYTWHGKAVSNCGFAFDYHDGLYSFVDAWVTTTDGHTAYLDQPELFSLRIDRAVEHTQINPLLPLLAAGSSAVQ